MKVNIQVEAILTCGSIGFKVLKKLSLSVFNSAFFIRLFLLNFLIGVEARAA
jgi:hypothetical protein